MSIYQNYVHELDAVQTLAIGRFLDRFPFTTKQELHQKINILQLHHAVAPTNASYPVHPEETPPGIRGRKRDQRELFSPPE